MMENDVILEMKSISKNFPGVKALDKVDLKVRRGTVHALMGENGAGKSTLMKCLFGMYRPDDGEIILDGEKVQFKNSKDSLQNGISMIHQELHSVPHRSVMENEWLGRFPTKKVFGIEIVNHKKMYEDTKDLLDKLKMNIDPNTLVSKLSVSQVQGLEIAKAISYNAKIIVMDEPTSSLTENEVANLFNIINDLKEQGVSIIYISHKMEEILQIADEVTIMRDGKYIGTWESENLTINLIISKMVGRDLINRFPPKENVPGEFIMEVEHLTSANEKSFKDISFELKKGEILGIGGLVGAQRTELVESIFGLRKIESGNIYINGQQVKIKSPIDSKKYGIALLTEERRSTGIFPVLTVGDNTLIAGLDKYVDFKFIINKKRGIKDIKNSIEKLNIRTPSHTTQMRNLSGGNQQKVIFSRWLLTDPDILIMDEPTRGIDVGAKYEIYSIISDLAKMGKSIIMISSEMSELIGMSDRIMVMCDGRLSGIINGKEATQEKIMRYATQFI